MCILSADRHNNILGVAKSLFNESYNICHYLLPNRGLLEMLKGIESKVSNFSEQDFVIILIGAEDFKQTDNYMGLILKVREILKAISHTNILVCAPTFKHGVTNTDIFNSRIEIFNNMICLDIMTHEHAFILDSNLNLKYDSTMFHSKNGALNRTGLKTIFHDIKQTLEDINNWYMANSSTNHLPAQQTDIEDSLFRTQPNEYKET